jgi:hypothetical protein
MRWKADLPKMPRLPKVPLEPGNSAPDALGPPPAPSAYREKNPYESQPVEYKAPSMLVEHRGLALLFVAAAIVFALYCWRTPHRTVAADAPSAHGAAQTGAAQSRAAGPGPAAADSPIYIEAVPDKNR